MDYTIDVPATKAYFEAILEKFISSELIQADALSLSEKELSEMLRKRASQPNEFRYLRCVLEKILHISRPIPWVQIFFQPYQRVGNPISLGRFTTENPVCIPEYGIINHGQLKANTILGCDEVFRQLDYFVRHKGDEYMKCYSFLTRDMDYNRNLTCIRFATMGYKREALLLTQGFIINHFLKYPAVWFPGVYVNECKDLLSSPTLKKEMLTPIMESRKNELLDIKHRIDEQLAEFNLKPEII